MQVPTQQLFATKTVVIVTLHTLVMAKLDSAVLVKLPRHELAMIAIINDCHRIRVILTVMTSECKHLQ